MTRWRPALVKKHKKGKQPHVIAWIQPGQYKSAPIFESFVISELYKNFVHRGKQPLLYFWRDSAGHEIDVLLEMGGSLTPVEIKSAQTVASDFFDGLNYWRKLSGQTSGPAALIYGGDRPFIRSGVAIYPWSVL